MKPPKPSITQESLLKDAANRILSALRANSEAQIEVVPAGWFTLIELSKQANISERQTSRAINPLLASGKWETKKFRIKTGGNIYPVPHYREKAASKH